MSEPLVLGADNIVSNPPYSDVESVVRLYLPLVRDTLALLLPADWLYSDKRLAWLETTPLTTVYPLTPRPSLPPGEVAVEGEASTGQQPKGGRNNFAWYRWDQGAKFDPKIRFLSMYRVGTVESAFL
jgi:hypothetical protein